METLNKSTEELKNEEKQTKMPQQTENGNMQNKEELKQMRR